MVTISKRDLEIKLKENPDLRVTGEEKAARVPPPTGKRRHKYGAIATEVHGIKFPSKKEAARYVSLRTLERAGQISRLELQPEFVLVPPFVDSDGKKDTGVKYRADFRYIQDGQVIVEDVKGKETTAFKVKWRMVRYLHRHTDISFIKT